MNDQLKADIKELSFAAGIADTFHGRNCCAALDRVEEALTHAIEHMKRWQWQPIETAPMCQDIDIWTQYGRNVRCQHDDYGHWYIWSDEFNQYVALANSIKPTHWMPLPEPPQERKN